MAIPEFDKNGNLPPGIHWVALDEIARRYAYNARRRTLFRGLSKALSNLRTAGVRRVWINGSFITAKQEPGDVDGCWEYSSDVIVERLDPVFLDVDPPRVAMKTKHGVDFLVASAQLIDSAPRGKTILDFFQYDRNGSPKGILGVSLEDEA